jgi:FkbM family methyltransferase
MDDYDIGSIEENTIDYFIDIGACVGEISIQVAKNNPDAKIIAYEPCKENYNILVKNTKKFPNIVTINEALGDGSDLYFNDIGRKDRHLFLVEDNGSYKIKSRRLSDIFKIHNVDTSKRCLLKIDCEGGEAFLIDDKESTNIIKSCFHAGIEVHFKHPSSINTWLNIFPEWKSYNTWIYSNFEDNYDIVYWRSNRKRGHGIYVLKTGKKLE